MKPLLSILILLSALYSPLSAQVTHLDIKVPDRVNSGFFGPVKKVVTEYNYDMSDRKYKEVRAYDKWGNLESRTKWDSKGKMTYLATNTFDEAGCFINQRIEDIRNKSTNDYEIVLNAPTRKIAYLCKVTGEVEVLSYNENKYVISATIKKRRGKTQPQSAYERNPDNSKKTYTRYEDGRLKYTVVYDWNEQGLLKRSLYTYKTEKKKSLVVYEYLSIDEHGNWTQSLYQSLDILDGKKKNFEKFSKREIEYYEED